MKKNISFTLIIAQLIAFSICFTSLICFSKNRAESLLLEEYHSLANEAIEIHMVTYDYFDDLFNDITRTNKTVLFQSSSPALLRSTVDASLVTIEKIEYPVSALDKSYNVFTQIDGRTMGATVSFAHTYNFYVLILYSLIFQISGALLFQSIAQWYRYIKQRFGHTPSSLSSSSEKTPLLTSFDRKIEAQVALLSIEQRSWFEFAHQKYNCPLKGLKVALLSDKVTIDIEKQCLLIKDIRITVPKTPLLYYLWYAKRKMAKRPPYLNPDSRKSDIESGHDVAELMEQHHGVPRVIESLRREGLRSKQLDTNRNKIKECLETELGTLAHRYLFHSERDSKLARFRYEIRLSACKINIVD